MRSLAGIVLKVVTLFASMHNRYSQILKHFSPRSSRPVPETALHQAQLSQASHGHMNGASFQHELFITAYFTKWLVNIALTYCSGSRGVFYQVASALGRLSGTGNVIL